MRFNHRRQSRDRRVYADIVENLGGGKLYLEEASAPLFDSSAPLVISDNPAAEAGFGDACFLEHPPIRPLLVFSNILVIYRWNRIYPADERLDFRPEEDRLLSRIDFPGFSHEKITREIYQL